jgi:hypothetical protein
MKRGQTLCVGQRRFPGIKNKSVILGGSGYNDSLVKTASRQIKHLTSRVKPRLSHESVSFSVVGIGVSGGWFAALFAVFGPGKGHIQKRIQADILS